jgi:uncharacterized protein (DUF2141 family)
MAILCAALMLAPASYARAGASTADAKSPVAAASPAAGDPPGDVMRVQVIGLRNDTGRVGCSLFNDPAGFPRDRSKILRHIWAPIRNRRALCRFDGLPPGTYAVVVFHDENSNGKFDTNMLGIPKEGYGFSRDAPVRFHAPSFKSCAFGFDGKRIDQVIKMRY